MTIPMETLIKITVSSVSFATILSQAVRDICCYNIKGRGNLQQNPEDFYEIREALLNKKNE